jgi:hypothetical protein
MMKQRDADASIERRNRAKGKLDEYKLREEIRRAKREPPSRLLVAALAFACGAVVALTVAWAIFGRTPWHDVSTPGPVSSAVAAPPVVIPPGEEPQYVPPPSEQGPAIPPHANPFASDPTVYDRNFLSLMTQEGWVCTGGSFDEQCKEKMTNFAHSICSYSGQSIALLYQNFGVPDFFGPREVRRAIANAQVAYPNCTFTGDY